MPENKYRELAALKKGSAVFFKTGSAECILCPDMGGRIFCECLGISPHRIDLDCAAHPLDSFNNFGGYNFWPAPEGGKFGFNYRGNEWYVQPAINAQPFLVLKSGKKAAMIGKEVTLVNRAGVKIETSMRRDFRLDEKPPAILREYPLKGFISYSTTDSFKVRNRVSSGEALIAAWTLEQFEASDETVSFCAVPDSKAAINFDFYDHPGDKITYYGKGFTYRTDARRKGQIGIKKSAGARYIGFFDLSRNLVCVRKNLNPRDGIFFNIADNDQARGPYSAADNYSIFNSDESMKAFELETVGGALIRNSILKGSKLASSTCLAVFERAKDIDDFIDEHLGKKKSVVSSQ
jgi:hypothetical protein